MINLIEKIISLPTEKSIKECINFFDNNIFKDIYKDSVFLSNCDSFDLDVISTCHIDVVPSKEYKLTKKDNICYGRGVFDMKSFLVSALFNLKKLQNSNLKYGVIIVANEETVKESDTKYWSKKLKTKIVLDSDSGIGDINKIVQNTLGAITIKSESNFDKSLFKNNFGKYYCDFFGNEIDMLFDNNNVIDEIKKYIDKFYVIMFNKCINNDINNKYHIIYRNICESYINNKIEYITTKNTTDSRFFDDSVIISHQSNGGDYHKPTEWLDYDSLLKFNNIQFDFLQKISNDFK